MIAYQLTKTFVSGILTGITTTTIVRFDGPCRFKVGQVVKGIGGGSYRVDSIQTVSEAQ